ncbi:MAG: lytic transglycosylase domain-containing protein [Clostridia bacterium]|nr:lytic transglycosylase domain-containing protein [Clostridia bacterium]
MKYKEEIEQLSEKYAVDGAIVASVANVESGFNEDAVSNKGAVGIMQLMPSTAQWLASKINIEYSQEKLLDGAYNIELGAYYLSFLIDYFQDERVGICAYNAGQGNVASWLNNKEYSSDGKTLSYIPFEETRNYLAKVLNQYNYYKNKYK